MPSTPSHGIKISLAYGSSAASRTAAAAAAAAVAVAVAPAAGRRASAQSGLQRGGRCWWLAESMRQRRGSGGRGRWDASMRAPGGRCDVQRDRHRHPQTATTMTAARWDGIGDGVEGCESGGRGCGRIEVG